MKHFLSLSLAVLATSTLTSFIATKQASANLFTEEQIDQQQLVAVAVPFGFKNHYLTIIEQISGQKRCWQESGSTPVTIDPLLVTFDFTGSCNRATDTNGYSIRIDGYDRTDYRLEIVERNNELHLIATNHDPNQPQLFIGRTTGISQNKNLTKIFIHPGWQITKRVYQGQTLGHFYLSGNSRTIFQNTPVVRQNNNHQAIGTREESLEPVKGEI